MCRCSKIKKERKLKSSNYLTVQRKKTLKPFSFFHFPKERFSLLGFDVMKYVLMDRLSREPRKKNNNERLDACLPRGIVKEDRPQKVDHSIFTRATTREEEKIVTPFFKETKSFIRQKYYNSNF